MWFTYLFYAHSILLILCVVERQVKLAIFINVGVHVDSVRGRALTSLVLCFRTCTSVDSNPLLPFTTQQRWCAATVCLAWNETTSAARRNAGHADIADAESAPVVGFVGALLC